jgi:phosphopantetheinyl transferase
MTLKILKLSEVSEAELSPWREEALIRMPDVHKNRITEWALARLALAKCFKKHGIELTPSQFVFKDYQTLSHLPAWRFSLSHSKEVAAAWLEPAAKFRGLGLDVELADRKVPPQVKARLQHSQDMAMKDLELWSLKEAAYKALPTLAQQDIWLNRLIIAEQKFSLENSPFTGSWSLSQEADVVIAKAWLL